MTALVLPRSWGSLEVEPETAAGEPCVRFTAHGPKSKAGTVLLRVAELALVVERLFLADPPAEVTAEQRAAARAWLERRGAR